MPVKVADIYAVAFVGRGLLVEAIPAAATYAAQDFSPRLFAEIIREVYRIPSTTCVNPLYLWACDSCREHRLVFKVALPKSRLTFLLMYVWLLT